MPNAGEDFEDEAKRLAMTPVQAEAGTAREIIAEELPRCYINSDYLKDADAIIAALHAAGIKLMAREPTSAMVSISSFVERDVFRAMWDAAP